MRPKLTIREQATKFRVHVPEPNLDAITSTCAVSLAFCRNSPAAFLEIVAEHAVEQSETAPE